MPGANLFAASLETIASFPLATWTLSSPWMLSWLGLAIVPLALHLWGKRATSSIAWGAMGLLRKAVAMQANHYRFRRLLLLLIRLLAVAMLAIAWSQPTRWFPLPPQESDGRQLLVIVLDGSISMDLRQGEKSRWDLAKEWANQRIQGASQGTAFALVVMANPPQLIVRHPAFGAKDVLGELNSLEVTHCEASLTATLAEVQTIVQEAKASFPQLTAAKVLFFTDLEKQTWEPMRSGEASRAAEPLSKLASLHLFVVAEANSIAKNATNQSILNTIVSPSLLQVGDRFQVEVELANFDTERGHQHTVQLFSGGTLADEQDISIAAGGRATCVLSGTASSAGDLPLELRIAKDDFPADDIWYQIASVRQSLRILAIEGGPQELFPFCTALKSGNVSDALQIDQIPQSAFSDINLSIYDAIILGNLAELSAQEGTRLKRFVREGGGLIILSGSRLNPSDLMNKVGVVGDGQSDSILPGKLGTAIASANGPLQVNEFRHPIVRPFQGFSGGGLEDIPVWRHLPLTPAPGTLVALALSNGDPLLVTSRCGSGTVVLWTTSTSEKSIDTSVEPVIAWSAFSTWPSFPPLAQEMLGYAVTLPSAPRQFSAGQTIRGMLRTQGEADPQANERAETSLELRDAQGRREQIVSEWLETGLFWEARPRLKSGIIELFSEAREMVLEQLAVNASRRESSLETIATVDLPPILQVEALASSGNEGLALPATPSSEAWFHGMLVAALLLLVAEVVTLAWTGRSIS